MLGIEVESQQFVQIHSDADEDFTLEYPGVFELEHTHTLISTNDV